jgi:hypothetical protein
LAQQSINTDRIPTTNSKIPVSQPAVSGGGQTSPAIRPIGRWPEQHRLKKWQKPYQSPVIGDWLKVI